jgi:hypothetical protein
MSYAILGLRLDDSRFDVEVRGCGHLLKSDDFKYCPECGQPRMMKKQSCASYEAGAKWTSGISRLREMGVKVLEFVDVVYIGFVANVEECGIEKRVQMGLWASNLRHDDDD